MRNAQIPREKACICNQSVAVYTCSASFGYTTGSVCVRPMNFNFLVEYDVMSYDVALTGGICGCLHQHISYSGKYSWEKIFALIILHMVYKEQC